MESKTSEKHITPKKTMQNILYEHVQGRLNHGSFNTESPFRYLPNFSTPPSRFTKIINPFEAHLSERLHLPVFSPSVFNKVSSPKTEEKFKWTIDEISSLKPADIDETSTEQFESTEHDAAIDVNVQEKISQFFSEAVIVPSPMNLAVTNVALITDSISPEKKTHELYDVSTQTLLSLPPKLPKHVEDVLKPYFHTSENEISVTETNQQLYENLFNFDNQRTPDSTHTSPAPSVGLSPIEFSPLPNKPFETARNSGSFCNSSPLRECELSSIETVSPDVPRERKSATKLDFSGHMSVDSICMVPDTLDQLPPNKSLHYESLNNSMPMEGLSQSTVNWDMEYHHVSFESPKNSPNEMDVSNSNTPRSRIFTSQRKKLSDSFLNDEFECDNKENICNIEVLQTAKTVTHDNTDAGYQTASTFTFEESTWNGTTHLFASTPTKSKNPL